MKPDDHQTTMKLSEQSAILLAQQAKQLEQIATDLASMLHFAEQMTAILRGMQLQVTIQAEQIAQMRRERKEP